MNKLDQSFCALTTFRMDLFGAAHGRGAKIPPPPLPKICRTYPAMIKLKLGSVIPYVQKIQKLYKSRDKPLEFC